MIVVGNYGAFQMETWSWAVKAIENGLLIVISIRSKISTLMNWMNFRLRSKKVEKNFVGKKCRFGTVIFMGNTLRRRSCRKIKKWDLGGICFTIIIPLFNPTHYFNLRFFSGTLLGTCSGDGTVKIWDFVESTCRTTFSDHSQAVWSVAFHDCGDFMVSGSMDHTARLWDINSERCRQTFRGILKLKN